MKLAAALALLLTLAGCKALLIPMLAGFGGTVAGNLTSDAIEGKWGK